MGLAIADVSGKGLAGCLVMSMLSALLHALLGVPDGASSLLWWLFAGTSVALTAWLVVGLTRASQEHPIG